MRSQWLLIGLGFAAIAVGNASWSYLQLIAMRMLPFPQVPDVFQLMAYAMLGCGVWSAMLGFKKFLDPRPALGVAAIACASFTAVLWFTTLQPILADTSMSPLGMALSVLYPLADIWVVMYPAIALAVMLTNLKGAIVARPWWIVSAGLLAAVCADTFFALGVWSGADVTAMAVEMGWWIAAALIATAASLSVDIHKPVAVAFMIQDDATEGAPA